MQGAFIREFTVYTFAILGCIWARYSMVIIPKNWNLFAVNIFLGATGAFQLARIYK